MPRSRVSSVTRSITVFCVVTSRPVVGSSAISKLRLAGERQRDDDALAHAAGQFERIGVIALARARDAHLVEDLDRLGGERGGIRLRVLAQHVLDLARRPCGSD